MKSSIYNEKDIGIREFRDKFNKFRCYQKHYKKIIEIHTRKKVANVTHRVLLEKIAKEKAKEYKFQNYRSFYISKKLEY